jgi:predicted 2-oxoglutarate/Fe(II)-dependent dioxygenase YbiX
MTLNKRDLKFYKDDIARIDNFVTPEEARAMIKYFESQAQIWGDVAFYNSLGMGIAPHDQRLIELGLDPKHFDNLKNKFKQTCEMFFKKELRPNTSHAQKWKVGGFAAPHSDNSDHDGNPNAFHINKYVGILYLNDDYEGGELYFPDHKLEFKPPVYSFIMFPGGHENIHGVKEITKGTRYTMVSFWDYADAVYDEETLDKWEKEIEKVREEQAVQKIEWDKGNKLV